MVRAAKRVEQYLQNPLEILEQNVDHHPARRPAYVRGRRSRR
jgi:hypothetical protein